MMTEDTVVVRSKIKSALEDKTMNVAGAFADDLNKAVVELIKKAEKRAKGNKRKTLKPWDV